MEGGRAERRKAWQGEEDARGGLGLEDSGFAALFAMDVQCSKLGQVSSTIQPREMPRYKKVEVISTWVSAIPADVSDGVSVRVLPSSLQVLVFNWLQSRITSAYEDMIGGAEHVLK
jgi:hypothetical protein